MSIGSLGIDIGGTRVKAALVVDGQARATSLSDPYERPAREALLHAAWSAVHALGNDAPRAHAVGVCAPGILDRARGIITRAINVPGLEGLTLADLVSHATGAPARTPLVTSDAHAAAFDLWRLDRSPGRWLALSLGTGVGACVLDDGRPLHVSGETPGHLGHMDVSAAGSRAPIAPDGSVGSLEAYIGLPALRARGGPIREDAIERLTPHDPAIAALVRALRIAHAIYRPQHVRLAGGVGIRLAPLASAIRELVDTGLTTLARTGWTLSCGTNDHHAAIGAACLAFASEASTPSPR